jgi:tetratricopeptide (TPR) repeat protein
MIANALNRLAQAFMAREELDNAEKVLTSAMEMAKRLPDTLGAGKDKEMYIKRHFGILYQMRGEYERAIKYYSESAQRL